MNIDQNKPNGEKVRDSQSFKKVQCLDAFLNDVSTEAYQYLCTF